MNDAVQQARLSAAVWECERHRSALAEALAEWHAQPTPSSEALEQDSALRRLTDQILYRFTKLQDVMGERLDRLERLGFIDVETWLTWRDVRYRLAHEYPGAAELRHAAVLAATAAAAAMLGAFEGCKAHLPGTATASA